MRRINNMGAGKLGWMQDLLHRSADRLKDTVIAKN